VHTDLDTLATALDVKFDDELKADNKRLRLLASQIQYRIRLLARDTDLWTHPVRIADSTPVECGKSDERNVLVDLVDLVDLTS